MQWRNSPERYGAIAQTLHWLVVILIAVQFTLGAMAEDLPVGMARLQLLARHKSLGMTIFMLVLLRLGWRLYSPPPPLPATMGAWQQRLAHGTHWLFYALLLTMPVAGWISSSASNLSVSWYGIFVWPDLVQPDRDLAVLAEMVHAFLAGLLALLVLVHVAAALGHHFVLRDKVLTRMLPLPRSRREAPP